MPVLWTTSAGRLVGWAASAGSPNGDPRAKQAVASEQGRLDLAREFVSSKIAGQATLLRRHGGPVEVVARLRVLARTATHATSLAILLGVEGDAAAQYFRHFASMLKPTVVAEQGLSFTGRVRRPATDPVNAALNYAYALLLADTVRAVLACGLDPHHGFLHSSGRNKPALALDLAEEFRAAVADSVVLGPSTTENCNAQISAQPLARLPCAIKDARHWLRPTNAESQELSNIPPSGTRSPGAARWRCRPVSCSGSSTARCRATSESARDDFGRDP